jgi:hypothetical protein
MQAIKGMLQAILIHGFFCKCYNIDRRVTEERGQHLCLPTPINGQLFSHFSDASGSNGRATGVR